MYDGLRATVSGVHREMKNDLDEARKEIEALDQQVKGLAGIKWVLLCKILILKGKIAIFPRKFGILTSKLRFIAEILRIFDFGGRFSYLERYSGRMNLKF